MTCNTTNRRRSNLPVLLLAKLTAQQEYERLSDSHNWASVNGFIETSDTIWPELRAAYEAKWAADEAYERARIEELYPVEAHS